jgi:predicted Fe-Mo cluster-binding NifX family protein
MPALPAAGFRANAPLNSIQIKEINMKICIPIIEDKGLESPVCGHFGSAPAFLLAEAETGQFEILSNGNQHHAHGMCQPLQALAGASPDALVVGGIGQGALLKLNAAGVRVYFAVAPTVGENLTALKEGRLSEATVEASCGHHRHGGGSGTGCGGHGHGGVGIHS